MGKPNKIIKGKCGNCERKRKIRVYEDGKKKCCYCKKNPDV